MLELVGLKVHFDFFRLFPVGDGAELPSLPGHFFLFFFSHMVEGGVLLIRLLRQHEMAGEILQILIDRSLDQIGSVEGVGLLFRLVIGNVFVLMLRLPVFLVLQGVGGLGLLLDDVLGVELSLPRHREGTLLLPLDVSGKGVLIFFVGQLVLGI